MAGKQNHKGHVHGHITEAGHGESGGMKDHGHSEGKRVRGNMGGMENGSVIEDHSLQHVDYASNTGDIGSDFSAE